MNTGNFFCLKKKKLLRYGTFPPGKGVSVHVGKKTKKTQGAKISADGCPSVSARAGVWWSVGAVFFLNRRIPNRFTNQRVCTTELLLRFSGICGNSCSVSSSRQERLCASTRSLTCPRSPKKSRGAFIHASSSHVRESKWRAT